MNRKLGMISAVVTLVGVLGFALSMLAGTINGSYFMSLVISWGFVPMVSAFAAAVEPDAKATGYTAIAFGEVYAVLVGLVYFAQLTTVRLSPLSAQASELLNYESLGSLFFNYDLFGYGFMALATFFVGLGITALTRSDRWLKGLLLAHGIFFPAGVTLPMLGIFTPGMAGGDMIGVVVLLVWCAYFTPVCILAFRHFQKQPHLNANGMS